MRRPSIRVAATFALLAPLIAALAIAGGTAFGCIPAGSSESAVSIEPSPFGAAGSSVTVNGVGLNPGPAEVRWNGPEGPLLASGAGPQLNAPITLPAVDPGRYEIYLLSRAENGTVSDTVSASVLVTEAAPTAFATTTLPAAAPPSAAEEYRADSPKEFAASQEDAASGTGGGLVPLMVAGAIVVTVGVLVAKMLIQRSSGTDPIPPPV